MSERTDCVVVGGGPAGMVLGLLLARAGVEVTVLEKHGDFLRDFRGDTVHPSTMQLLDELGLGEKFAALPQSRISEVVIPRGDGDRTVVADLRMLKTAHPYIAMVPQWDLLSLLAEAGRAEPTFTLRMNTEVTDLIGEAGRVAGVRYREADGKTGELRANLVVGCDGRWSVVRQKAGLEPREFAVPMDTWWFRLPRDEGEIRTLAPIVNDGSFVSLIPREGYFQIGYSMRKGIDARLREEGLDRFRERIAETLPMLADRVDAIESMDDVKHLDIRVNRLPRWHVDGLLCIGDAAHAMSPVGGVGINLAVQDAMATARLLAEPLRRGYVTEVDLAKVRRRRRLPTVAVQGLQRILHSKVVKPAVEGRHADMPKPVAKILYLTRLLPSYLIGVGFRPEPVPAFARRPSESPSVPVAEVAA
ncbi:FAD-dependent oxidoreductase [Amycolatopsis pigmentata]|uniref:FAD-dependent oxidoreductase n=1 Tax=Amycolatopsis pigmentata TaxID=450801 RepID=A0ABW5G1B6_9PSEU